MKCVNCYRKIDDNLKFCIFCGAKQPNDREAYEREHPELAGALSEEEVMEKERQRQIEEAERLRQEAELKAQEEVEHLRQEAERLRQETERLRQEAELKAQEEVEHQARIAEAQAMAESDAKNAELTTEKVSKKNKKRTYIAVLIVGLLLLGLSSAAYLKILTGKSVAELAADAAYNKINYKSIEDIEVSTEDVPSDDPSVVIDPNGNVKAQLEQYYETVLDLNGGFYKLKDKGKYGIADPLGKIIQRPKYDEILSKNQYGLIKVIKNDRIGYLNLKGVEVITPKYSNIEDPKDGLIKVEIDGLFGFLNANTLEEATPCIYSYIFSKADGKYKALQGTTIVYLNEDGSVSQ